MIWRSRIIIRTRDSLQQQTEPEKSDYEKVLTALKEYCLPKTNETINRHIFFARNQKQGENFIYYLSEIKKLALTCNFGDLRDGLIRDKLINGIIDPKLRERLLREPDLTLERCIEMCKTTEIATGYLHQLQEEDTQKIDKINKKQFNTNQQPKMFKCRSCGYEHSHRQCPAYGKMCSFCKKSNHFASVCRSKQWNAHKIKEIQQDEEKHEILLGSINTQDWTVQE
ncbi:hypothetical protein evm_006977 [Chilo suppressalis]|nr:hypothetical protein evm_006977 [Chilo suppressalis]